MKTKFIACAVVLSSLFSAASFAHENHDHEHDHDHEVVAEATQSTDATDASESHNCADGVHSEEHSEDNAE